MQLGRDALSALPAAIGRPAFDTLNLRAGIVHLGLGNFHRAHQAVFTEDAIAVAGGDWGIVGVSLKHETVPDALAPQDGLYTVETLSEERGYRVIGVLRRCLSASRNAAEIVAALASADIHLVTLTITEKGYCLDASGALDLAQPDVVHDLAGEGTPRSAIGWLVKGLGARRREKSGPLSIVSCDNLADNGGKLARAVHAFAAARDSALARWIEDQTSFPRTMVDCIAPKPDDACRARVRGALGVSDAMPVMCEAFAEWVIEDRFVSRRPAWETAGAKIVTDVAPYERLKLHVLNLSHSALAYLGIPKGHRLVRDAISDPELAAFLDGLIAEEVAPFLSPLDVGAYWQTTRLRFANLLIDHRLDQIAEDGSVKLAQRLFPVLIDNVRTGTTCRRLATIVRAWLDFARAHDVVDPARDRLVAWAAAGGNLEQALDDLALFPEPFRIDPRIRAAILRS